MKSYPVEKEPDTNVVAVANLSTIEGHHFLNVTNGVLNLVLNRQLIERVDLEEDWQSACFLEENPDIIALGTRRMGAFDLALYSRSRKRFLKTGAFAEGSLLALTSCGPLNLTAITHGEQLRVLTFDLNLRLCTS